MTTLKLSGLLFQAIQLHGAGQSLWIPQSPCRSQYVFLIKDPLFASSMKTARNRIFFACLMDLTLYVLKTIHARKMQHSQNLYSFARQFFFETLPNPEEVFESMDREKVTLDSKSTLLDLIGRY
ncbi:MAG: hypothetical protein CM1200mP16_15450 [Nitrospina sp.]|nr:MAG: hypothetical protein CM1200mP16_15450 [Nitrospina sp.]